MYSLHTFALVLIALLAARPEPTIGAPVPKAPPPASIEGKYNLIAVAYPDGGNWGPNIPAGPGAAPGVVGGRGGTRIVRANPAIIGPAVVTRSEITLEGRSAVLPSAVPTTWEYTLDASKSPMTIDVQSTTLRGKKSKPLLGVAEVNGNRLIIALAEEGKERPKGVEEAEDVTVYYFQKQPPPPRTEYRIVALTVGKEADVQKDINKLCEEGFELVNTTQPLAADSKSSPSVIHFVLRRTVRPEK